MEHAWCHDIARDAAVRAAEDGRDRPLPTLGECIDGMFPKSVSATSTVEQENKGVRMTKSDRQAADYRAEAIARPFAEAAERSVPVSKTVETQSGMRTERVALEFEIERGSPPSEWPWSYILSRSDALKMRPGESVRVVEETHFDDLAQVVVERDAAIRERESLREQLESVACRAATAETALAEIKSLDYTRAAVNGAAWQANKIAAKALEAASGGGEGEAVAWGVEISGHVQACYFTKYWADRLAEEEKGTLVPLYRAPPQPRWWLSEDEREAVERARREAEADAGLCADEKNAALGASDATVLAALLARSSPPEVVLPGLFALSLLGDRLLIESQVKEALTAAGVAVKEVGGE